MKPAPFRYERVNSLDQAVEFLTQIGDDAKIIAGGQILVAMMNLRLVRPTALVDINSVPGYAYVFEESGGIRIGALTRHRQLEWYAGSLVGFSVLRTAAGLIGHYPIRARGTFGGSIAHADPTAEWCMLARLFEAQIQVLGPNGSRSVRAEEFFQGYFVTSLAEDEVVLDVFLPRGRSHSALVEFARRSGDFAIVAVAMAFDERGGLCVNPRVVIGGVDSVPFRSQAAERAMDGQPVCPETFRAAGEEAAADIEPAADVHATAEYRRLLTKGLVLRAGQRAMASELPGRSSPTEGER
jgi:aerobic carbon-monoxide dehydrogenase medium subunit